MFGRRKRLMLLGLGLAVAAGMAGCDQPSDVVSPITRTQITLTPQLLPTTPPGMVYELFVAPDFDINTQPGNISGAVSIARFRYNAKLVKFLDTADAARTDGNQFWLNDDFLKFDKVFISVDTLNDPSGAPGPIMVIDDATDPGVDAVKMILPYTSTDDGDKALWDRTVSFNMETPSDSSRVDGDGYGVWFSRYSFRQATIQDTNALVDYSVDTLYRDSLTEGNPQSVIDSIVVDTSGVVTKTFGLESFDQNFVNYTVYSHPAEFIDTLNQYLVTRADITWDLGLVDTVVYDDFFLVDTEWFAYPGWTYKGWIVSPKLNTDFPNTIGTITEPAWNFVRGGYDYLPGRQGSLLTTGTFSTIQSGLDSQNPYTIGGSSGRIPKLPGEDFLTGLSGDSLQIVPLANTVDQLGSVFITLEPDNFVGRSTNFPLFIFTRRMPVAPGGANDSLHINDVLSGVERFDMKNWARTNDPTSGAPKVIVTISRL